MGPESTRPTSVAVAAQPASHRSLLRGALDALLAVVLDLKSRREEIWLRERFPEYKAYAARTRKFIPGIY